MKEGRTEVLTLYIGIRIVSAKSVGARSASLTAVHPLWAQRRNAVIPLSNTRFLPSVSRQVRAAQCRRDCGRARELSVRRSLEGSRRARNS